MSADLSAVAFVAQLEAAPSPAQREKYERACRHDDENDELLGVPTWDRRSRW